MSASNPLIRILETNCSISFNYKDWIQNLKIILSSERLNYIIDQDIPMLPAYPIADWKGAYKKWLDDNNKARCYVLASMSNELRCQHEDMKMVKTMLDYLKELYGE